MTELKIIPNPDTKKYAEVSVAVFANSGFCPCAIEKNADTHCPCKDFREQKEEELCTCGRYMKVGVENGTKKAEFLRE